MTHVLSDLVLVVDLLRHVRRRGVDLRRPLYERLPRIAPDGLQGRREEAEPLAVLLCYLLANPKQPLVEISDVWRDRGKTFDDLLLRRLRCDVLEEVGPDEVLKRGALSLSARSGLGVRDLLEAPRISERGLPLSRRQLPPSTSKIENVLPLEPPMRLAGADVDNTL